VRCTTAPGGGPSTTRERPSAFLPEEPALRGIWMHLRTILLLGSAGQRSEARVSSGAVGERQDIAPAVPWELDPVSRAGRSVIRVPNLVHVGLPHAEGAA
jgi:hypothetical protein